MKAQDVTSDDIYEVIQRIYERGALIVADHTRSYLMAAFNFGMQAKYSPGVKVSATYHIIANPVSPIKPVAKVTPGERNLSKDEIVQLWFSLECTGMHLQTQVALKLLLATGQRVKEVLGIQWRDIQLEGKLWELWKHDAKGTQRKSIYHVIPLTEFSIKLIESLRGLNDSRYLFPQLRNKEKCMPYNSLSQAVERYCSKSAHGKYKPVDKFIPKDMRRTVKSRMGEIGIKKSDRDRLQNHALHDVSSKHYDRYDYLKEKRTTIKTWNDWLDLVLVEQDDPKQFCSSEG